MIVCQSSLCVCVSAVRTNTCASASRQKRRCCRLPESGTPLSPADFKMLNNKKRDTCTHTHQWKSLSSAHRLAYLTSQVLSYSRGEGVKKCQSTDSYFFCQAMSKKKNMPTTYVGILGTQPSKNGNKPTKQRKQDRELELWTSKRTLSSPKHQSAMKTAFFSLPPVQSF